MLSDQIMTHSGMGLHVYRENQQATASRKIVTPHGYSHWITVAHDPYRTDTQKYFEQS
jgi:hypothetical protein